MGGSDLRRNSGIVGRDAEEAAIHAFLDRVAYRPAALTLAGEPGIGKTALLDSGTGAARQRDYQVLWCSPAEAEARLSFAALTDLFADAIDDEVRASLPVPQREALDVVLLLDTPRAATMDQRTISAGVLSVVRTLAERAPILLAVDDLQWLDGASASSLAFVVRRLRGKERVGVLATVRTSGLGEVADGLLQTLSGLGARRLHVGPLDASTIGRVVTQRLSIEFPISVLRKIENVSAGNPLFALEIARWFVETASSQEQGTELDVPADLRQTLRTRLESLSRPARRALLLASALAHPTVSSISAAGAHAGLEEAAAAGIAETEGESVRLTHPLFASVLYGDASIDERRGAHRDLAEIVRDPEERARHVALAAVDPDDRIAALVEQGALQARARGAPISAAELFELAARLTPVASAPDADRRWMQQADVLFLAGEERRALELLAPIVERARPGPTRAEARFRLAWILSSFDIPKAARILAEALEEEGVDVRLRSRLRSELAYDLFAMGALSEAERSAAEAVELAESSADPTALAIGLGELAAIRVYLGWTPSFELFDRAVTLEHAAETLSVTELPSFGLGTALADIDELERSRAVLTRLLQLCEARGDDHSAGNAHYTLGLVELRAGNLDVAEAHLSEPFTALVRSWPLVNALSAQVEGCLGHVESARDRAQGALDAAERGAHIWSRLESRQALGFIELSLGNHQMTIGHLEPAWELHRRIRVGEPSACRFPADLAESLIAVGRLDEAEPIIGWLAERGQTLGRNWAIGAAGRCRGLLHAARGNLPTALSELQRASDVHRKVGVPFELGRTLLALGRAGRRAKRKRQAREALEEAAHIFERLPAPLWAARARSELSRISGRRPSPGRLTPTEERVGQLAAAGRTNQEIADVLFVSIRTVESHLSRMYAKLGVRSRTELAAVLQRSAIPT